MQKIGVVLSGCGVMDGAEIHESVITLLAIDRAGAEAVCMAPNVEQAEVINHLTGSVAAGERRNVLVEAARIARGKIRDLATVGVAEIDGLILPGGYGAAKNLSTFATQGDQCSVNGDLRRLVQEVWAAKKPIGAICIAPAVLAQIFGIHPTVELTIGTDAPTAKALVNMGARHQDCPVDQIVVDCPQKIVSTPAYMLAGRISEAAAGIEKLVAEVIHLAQAPQ